MIFLITLNTYKLMYLTFKNLQQLIILLCLMSSIPMLAQVQLGNTMIGEMTGDGYGRSMALSADGKRVAGSAANNDANGSNSGHVRVHEYQASTATWVQIGNDIDGGSAGEQLGFSVDLSGDGKRLVVLAPYYLNNGKVKVFEELNGVWIQLGSSFIGQTTEQLNYAVSISTDGKRIAMGTRHNKVKIFEETNGFWTQVGTTLSGSGIFGFSLDLSSDGKRLVVGAPNNNTASTGAGQTQIFEETNGVWTQVGAGINGLINGDQSGYSVALSSNGKRVIIGAIYHEITMYKGLVRVFDENGGVWTQVGVSLAGDNNYDGFGRCVGISANGKRIIATSYKNTTGGSNAGHAKIYEDNNGTWTPVGTTINGTTQSRDGSSVAISGDGHTIGLGATGFNSFIGRVRVFGIPIAPACIETKNIVNRYCKRRDYLLEPLRVVHTKEVVLEISNQGTLPSGTVCTGAAVAWTHFNIKTEAFPASGPMTTPVSQKTTNNIPVSSWYTLAGSNSSFYYLPNSAIAPMNQSITGNNTYRLRVTLTGVKDGITSAHSTQYVLSVSTNKAHLCTTPLTNPGLTPN